MSTNESGVIAALAALGGVAITKVVDFWTARRRVDTAAAAAARRELASEWRELASEWRELRDGWRAEVLDLRTEVDELRAERVKMEMMIRAQDTTIRDLRDQVAALMATNEQLLGELRRFRQPAAGGG